MTFSDKICSRRFTASSISFWKAASLTFTTRSITEWISCSDGKVDAVPSAMVSSEALAMSLVCDSSSVAIFWRKLSWVLSTGGGIISTGIRSSFCGMASASGHRKVLQNGSVFGWCTTTYFRNTLHSNNSNTIHKSNFTPNEIFLIYQSKKFSSNQSFVFNGFSNIRIQRWS